MAHIIHLATRALISTYSQAPFYNPEQTELELSIENGCYAQHPKDSKGTSDTKRAMLT